MVAARPPPAADCNSIHSRAYSISSATAKRSPLPPPRLIRPHPPSPGHTRPCPPRSPSFPRIARISTPPALRLHFYRECIVAGDCLFVIWAIESSSFPVRCGPRPTMVTWGAHAQGLSIYRGKCLNTKVTVWSFEILHPPSTPMLL